MLKWVCFKVWIVHELDCITKVGISLFYWVSASICRDSTSTYDTIAYFRILSNPLFTNYPYRPTPYATSRSSHRYNNGKYQLYTSSIGPLAPGSSQLRQHHRKDRTSGKVSPQNHRSKVTLCILCEHVTFKQMHLRSKRFCVEKRH